MTFTHRVIVMLVPTMLSLIGCGTQGGSELDTSDDAIAHTQQMLGAKDGIAERKRCFPENGMVKNNDRFDVMVQYDDMKGASWCRWIKPGTSTDVDKDDIDWVMDRAGNWYQIHGVLATVNSDGTVSGPWGFVSYDPAGPPPCARDTGGSAPGCKHFWEP